MNISFAWSVAFVELLAPMELIGVADACPSSHNTRACLSHHLSLPRRGRAPNTVLLHIAMTPRLPIHGSSWVIAIAKTPKQHTMIIPTSRAVPMAVDTVTVE